MKYIDYVNDWFSLYINPLDYDNDSSRFIQHIFATIPLLNRLPSNAELNALKDVITLNAEILMQSIESDSQQDSIDVFKILNEQIQKLKEFTRSYAVLHFDEVCHHDSFYIKFQDYINKTGVKLLPSEQNAIKGTYALLHLEALAVDLTRQIAEQEYMPELLEQTQIDTHTIEIEKIRFLGKARCIIIDSESGANNLKNAIQQNMLAFCQFIEENTSEKLKFDARQMKRLTGQFAKEHFNKMRSLEKIMDEIKVDNLTLQGLIEQEQRKQRSQANLEIIQQRIASQKQKMMVAEELFAQTQYQIEQAMVAFYQSALRFPVKDDLKEIIALYKLDSVLDKKNVEKSILYRGFSLLKLVTGAFDRCLPSQRDMQLGAFSVAAGALAIGAGPLGVAAGVSMGIAAIKTRQSINQVVDRVNDEYKGLKQAWHGKFSATYQSDDFKMTDALIQVCGNDAVNAQVINAFYVRAIFNWDLQLVDTLTREQCVQEQALKEAKSHFEKHYRQLRNGAIKPKDFWDKIFRKDIAMRVVHLQQQCAHHTEEYIKSLHEYFSTNDASVQIQLHRRRLEGIREELALLKLMHDRHSWRKLREQATPSFRLLVQLPLDCTFEDHVDQLMLKGSSGHLLFWLQEQAQNPRKKMAEPLLRYQGKTFWHLLAELENGFEIYQKMISTSSKPGEARWSAKLVAGLKSLFQRFQNSNLFDPTVSYNGMNPLAYAYENRNIPLLRLYLEQVMQHPSCVERVGITAFFSFVLKAHPEIDRLLESQKQSALATFANKMIQRTSLELSLISALTMCLAKEEKIPTTTAQWVTFINELRHSTSSYVQVKIFVDFDGQRIQHCAQTLSQVKTLPVLTMEKQPFILDSKETAVPALLISYSSLTPTKVLAAESTQGTVLPKLQQRV